MIYKIKKELPECDRCGKEIEGLPDILSLLRSKDGVTAPAESYTFRVCTRCARALFAWVGNAEEAKP